MTNEDIILVPVRTFREHMADYFERVATGTTIIITKHGRPIAELRRSSVFADTR